MMLIYDPGAQRWLLPSLMSLCFFYAPLHQCKVSKLQQAALPDGTEVKMRQSYCWVAYVVGFEVSVLHLVNHRCFVLLDILATLIHNNDNKLLKPLNNFHNEYQ